MINYKIHSKYTIALFAAPIFWLLYIDIFQYKVIDILWLFKDIEALFFLIIFYPIIEELTFRGVIQSYILKKTKKSIFLGITIANILTSIIFVLIHFIYHEPLWALLTFIPSLLFGYFKDKYEYIFPSIFLHIFYNLCYFSFIGN